MLVLRHIVCASLMAGLLCAAPAASPQSTTSAAVSVPRYVSFTGELKNQEGKPAGGNVDVTFLLYEEESGGEPLWTENQRVMLDASGHFAVTLGANTTGGLPMEFFAAKKARWLAMEPEGLPMPDRVLLLSVPYAFKAADAETLGGLPASAFLRTTAAPRDGRIAASLMTPAGGVANTPGGGGTANYVPLWTPDGNTLGNSEIYQSGGNIGIGTTTPKAALHIYSANPTASGSLYQRWSYAGVINWFLYAPATSSSSLTFGSFGSVLNQVLTMTAGGLVGVGTTTPAAKLEVNGTGKFDGLVTFAPGQTFPGALTQGTGDGRYASLTGNNTFTGTQTIKNSVGIGISPLYPLHVNGVIRSEYGLSLGSNAGLTVDSPGVGGGRFTVDGTGHVGINNWAPQSALDVTGNIHATGALNAAGANFTGNVTFASGQTFPGLALLAGNNTWTGIQTINSKVGIGIAPAYPLHVNGAMRSETGLSLGGNATLAVDAPFVSGGHLLVDGAGNVGINNAHPAAALDVKGNIQTSGSLTIGSDPAMSSAPRMYLTSYLPGPLTNAGGDSYPISMVVSKPIRITRFMIGGVNPCSAQDAQYAWIWVTNLTLGTSSAATLTIGGSGSGGMNDSGPISYDVETGWTITVDVSTPNCGTFSGASPGNLAVTVEYVML
jgi:hypothetical protein